MNKTIYPNIVRGGIAIPLDRRNYFLVKGKTHEQGGIDIGNNPKTGLEVEDGEIVKMGNDGVKVYSAVPMLAGKSPAERVLMGEDPNKVFAAQETFKKVNGLKDDGTKAQLGKQKTIANMDNNPLVKMFRGTNNKPNDLIKTKQNNSKFAGLKTHDGRGYNSDYIDYIYDSLSKSNLNKMQQAVILSHIINESGGDPFALNKNSGKDYGLLQWVDRYTKTKETDPYKEIDNQLNYIYSTVNNLDDKVSWTHGGEGSGYQSLNDAYSDFSSEDLSTVNKGFSLGYVRPAGKHDSANNRFGLAEQIYNRIKRLGGEEKDKNTNKVSKNYTYKHFPYVAERLEFPLYTSRERKIVQDDPTKAIDISHNVLARQQMGEDIVKRINNFDKNDSLVYHPLLNRLNKYLEPKYNKDDYTDTELDNINMSVAMLRSLSERKTRPYNENHKFVNETLEKLTDDEIDKILNVNYFGKGASLVEGLKAKPKGISIKDMWRLKAIMDDEYFNYDHIKKQLGGDMKHKLVEVNIGGNSKLIRVPSRSSTGESERSEGRDKAELGINYGKLEPLNLKYIPITTPVAKINTPSTKIPTTPIPTIAKSGIWGDVIGVGSNIIGSLITRGINNKMINNLKAPTMPVLETARKLNTKYNINPQEEAIKENLAAYEQQVAGNTGSSRIALARINKGRNLATSQLVNLYGQKENIETQLRNQDTMNQQTVAARNIERINRHLTDVTNFNNRVTEMRADNNVATVQNINQGVQDLLARRDMRRALNNNLALKSFAAPNLPAELFYAAGIWDKNTYDMYRKQYAKS